MAHLAGKIKNCGLNVRIDEVI